eukprot:gene5552-biopygen5758
MPAPRPRHARATPAPPSCSPWEKRPRPHPVRVRPASGPLPFLPGVTGHWSGRGVGYRGEICCLHKSNGRVWHPGGTATAVWRRTAAAQQNCLVQLLSAPVERAHAVRGGAMLWCDFFVLPRRGKGAFFSATLCNEPLKLLSLLVRHPWKTGHGRRHPTGGAAASTVRVRTPPTARTLCSSRGAPARARRWGLWWSGHRRAGRTFKGGERWIPAYKYKVAAVAPPTGIKGSGSRGASLELISSRGARGSTRPAGVAATSASVYWGSPPPHVLHGAASASAHWRSPPPHVLESSCAAIQRARRIRQFRRQLLAVRVCLLPAGCCSGTRVPDPRSTASWVSRSAEKSGGVLRPGRV